MNKQSKAAKKDDPFNSGAQVYIRGQSDRINPYKKGSKEWNQWRDGYISASEMDPKDLGFDE